MDTLLGKVSLALGEREFDSLGNALDQYEVEVRSAFITVSEISLMRLGHQMRF